MFALNSDRYGLVRAAHSRVWIGQEAKSAQNGPRQLAWASAATRRESTRRASRRAGGASRVRVASRPAHPPAARRATGYVRPPCAVDLAAHRLHRGQLSAYATVDGHVPTSWLSREPVLMRHHTAASAGPRRMSDLRPVDRTYIVDPGVTFI